MYQKSFTGNKLYLLKDIIFYIFQLTVFPFFFFFFFCQWADNGKIQCLPDDAPASSWIGEIFLRCRTSEEINRAFEAIEVASVELDDSMKQTRLFHIADEIEEHRQKLWQICKYVYEK